MVELLAKILEAVPLLVAVCALYLTIQSNKTAQEQNEAARAHNRLSVKPRLTTATINNQTLFLEGTTQSLEFRVLLTNVGLGPAVIKRTQIMLDGNEVPAESFDDVRRLLNELFPGIQLGQSHSFFKLNKEHTMEVGKEVELVAFHVLTPPAEFGRGIKRVSVRIHYESLYEDPMHYDSRDHLQP